MGIPIMRQIISRICQFLLEKTRIQNLTLRAKIGMKTLRYHYAIVRFLGSSPSHKWHSADRFCHSAKNKLIACIQSVQYYPINKHCCLVHIAMLPYSILAILLNFAMLSPQHIWCHNYKRITLKNLKANMNLRKLDFS